MCRELTMDATVETGFGSLDAAAIASRLTTIWLGHRHRHEGTCASTNDLVAAEARAGSPEGLLITADAQTQGRGRLGRTWHSPANVNLYLSILLRPRRPATEIPPLTLLAGAVLARALRSLGFDASVKWPNDVLLRVGERHRKVAGILTEASTEGQRIAHVVLGMGVNVNTEVFPDDLADKATSLRLARGTALAREDVLTAILAAFEPAYERFQSAGVAAAIGLWEAHAELGIRCRAQLGSDHVEGVTTGVAADGALLIRDDAGVQHRVVSGEVIAVPAREI